MNLRPKIIILVIGTMLIFFTALLIPLYWYARSAVEEELDKRLITAVDMAAMNLNRDYINLLNQEQGMAQVRQAFEKQLSTYLIHQIKGIALYSLEGTTLAMAGRSGETEPGVPVLLRTFAKIRHDSAPVVSEIYELTKGQYLKAAAVPIQLASGPSMILVIWGGVEFMTLIDQLAGSIFWIVLISILIVTSLSILFSQSLIHPVRRLSIYAKSIQKNIYSVPVDLDRKDEFGDLNRALVEMHGEIKENEQRNKQLLSGIAHEIKNPLGGIEIYSGLLKEELDPEGIPNSYLKNITKELQHLKQIVFSYLDYARPVKSNLKTLHLESIIDNVHQLLAPEIKQKQIKFNLSGKGEITGDESKLRVVFINLLKNSLAAVDHQGRIDVRILSSAGSITVKVADDGEGILPAHLEEVFQPYFSTRDKGYGLGLAITKNIIDEMNGTIIAVNNSESGTIFTLTFPIDNNV